MSVQSGRMLLDMPLLQMRPLAELTAHGFERIAHGDMRIGVRGVSSWRACGDLFVPLVLDGDSDMKVLALARTLVLVTFFRRHTATVDARIKRSQLPQLFDPGRTATYGCPIFSSPLLAPIADCRLQASCARPHRQEPDGPAACLYGLVPMHTFNIFKEP